jgi:hypothetical protein
MKQGEHIHKRNAFIFCDFSLCIPVISETGKACLKALLPRLEEMSVSIPMESARQIETVGDAYRVYLESVNMGGEIGDVPSLA